MASSFCSGIKPARITDADFPGNALHYLLVVDSIGAAERLGLVPGHHARPV